MSKKNKNYRGEPLKQKNAKLKSRRTRAEKIEDLEEAKALLAECKETERAYSNRLTRITLKKTGAVVYTTDPKKYILHYGEENVIF